MFGIIIGVLLATVFTHIILLKVYKKLCALIIKNMEQKLEHEGKSYKEVLIHHIDADGFMSRYIAENYFGIQFDEIYPYNYEKTPQWMQDEDILDIFFVDVTPPIEYAKAAYQFGTSIHIFDHHPVAESFKKFTNCNVH